MDYKIMELKKSIIKCIDLCDNLKTKIRKGQDVESTLEQIEKFIEPELNQLMNNIENDKLPPRSERYLLSFANAFKVWNWNMQRPTDLFILLTKINNDYRDLR